MIRTVALAAALFSFACTRSAEPVRAAATTASELQSQPPQHLLLTVELSKAGLKILDRKVVESPLPKLRVPAVQPWRFELRDARSEKIFESYLPAQNRVRGEFGDDGGAIDGNFAAQESPVFLLRMPNTKGLLTLFEKRGDEEVQLGSTELIP